MRRGNAPSTVCGKGLPVHYKRTPEQVCQYNQCMLTQYADKGDEKNMRRIEDAMFKKGCGPMVGGAASSRLPSSAPRDARDVYRDDPSAVDGLNGYGRKRRSSKKRRSRR